MKRLFFLRAVSIANAVPHLPPLSAKGRVSFTGDSLRPNSELLFCFWFLSRVIGTKPLDKNMHQIQEHSQGVCRFWCIVGGGVKPHRNSEVLEHT